MDLHILGALIMVLCLIAFGCWACRKVDLILAKTHMKRISFSVDLANFWRFSPYGTGSGHQCKLCDKFADTQSKMITHLNHDHMDKEFVGFKNDP